MVVPQDEMVWRPGTCSPGGAARGQARQQARSEERGAVAGGSETDATFKLRAATRFGMM